MSTDDDLIEKLTARARRIWPMLQNVRVLRTQQEGLVRFDPDRVSAPHETDTLLYIPHPQALLAIDAAFKVLEGESDTVHQAFVSQVCNVMADQYIKTTNARIAELEEDLRQANVLNHHTRKREQSWESDIAELARQNNIYTKRIAELEAELVRLADQADTADRRIVELEGQVANPPQGPFGDGGMAAHLQEMMTARIAELEGQLQEVRTVADDRQYVDVLAILDSKEGV